VHDAAHGHALVGCGEVADGVALAAALYAEHYVAALEGGSFHIIEPRLAGILGTTLGRHDAGAEDARTGIETAVGETLHDG